MYRGSMKKGLGFIVAGLVVMNLYLLARSLGPGVSRLPAFVAGLWLGVGLGLEIVGILILKKARAIGGRGGPRADGGRPSGPGGEPA